jgi:hypothetical protein
MAPPSRRWILAPAGPVLTNCSHAIVARTARRPTNRTQGSSLALIESHGSRSIESRGVCSAQSSMQPGVAELRYAPTPDGAAMVIQILRVVKQFSGLDQACGCRLIPHICVACRSQLIQTTVHLFFVVRLAVAIDRH